MNGVLVFCQSVICLLVIAWVVLDLAEARQFLIVHEKEQQYANEQRKIQEFVFEEGTEVVTCRVGRKKKAYAQTEYVVYEPGHNVVPTAVLIPGALQDFKKHEYVGFKLACKGIRVVFMPVDILRRDIEKSFDEVVIEASQFVDEVKKYYGGVYLIVGHSLGGLVAIRMAMLQYVTNRDLSACEFAVFSPFLSLSLSPCAVVVHYFTAKQQKRQSNDSGYLLRNYGRIRQAQEWTLKQGEFLRARVHFYLSEHEHLIDNDIAAAFAAKAGYPVYYVKSSHFFAKSDFVIYQIADRCYTKTNKYVTDDERH